MYNSEGEFVRELYSVDPSSTEVPRGVFQTGDWLYIVLDGQDRIVRMNLLDLDAGANDFISNTNFTGTMGRFTQLTSGAFLAVETSNIEKFTADGIRDPTGGFPAALQTTGTGLAATANGGFIHCSTGTDVVRAYSSTGTQTATASSGIGGTTDVFDCGVSALSGKVFAVFNGTTDTVRVYNSSTLTPVTFSYSNLTLVPNPRTAAFTLTDNLLVADGTNNTIVEISSSGAFVRVFTTVGLSTPNFMTVIR